MLAEYPDNRPLAAQAQFRIGMCYEKLGRREAQKAYEDVLSKYTDQTVFASKARDRLAVLKAPVATPPRDSRLTIRRVPHMDRYGNPSPDGKFLAYIDWDKANVAVYETATDTTRALTKDGSWGEVERYPENLIWSPDSRQIAYTWNGSSGPEEEYHTELRIVSLDKGSPPRTVLKDERYVWPWDWAPDGTRILCGLQVGGPIMDRALVNVETGAVETLNLPSGSLGSLYRFTPGGDSILYSRSSDGEHNPDDIYVYDLKSGESKPVVEHPAEDLVVGILPGTDWLLFASNRRGSLDLWGVRFQKGRSEGQPLLLKQGLRRFIPLDFTNDGSFYYATLAVTDDVFLAEFDPGTQKISGEPQRLSSRWEGTTMDASFSPDGKSIAYVAYRGVRSNPHAADSLVVQSLADANAHPVVVGFSEFQLFNVQNPSWAADSQSIVLAGRRRGEKGNARGLFHVDLSNLRKTDIYWAPAGYALRCNECSRTTDSVYFALNGEQSPSTVKQIGLDGQGEKEIYAPRKDSLSSTLPCHPTSRPCPSSSPRPTPARPTALFSCCLWMEVPRAKSTNSCSIQEEEWDTPGHRMESLSTTWSRISRMSGPGASSGFQWLREALQRRFTGVMRRLLGWRSTLTAACSPLPAVSVHRTRPRPGSWKISSRN